MIFDYHKTDSSSFLHHLVLSAISDVAPLGEKQKFDELSERTKKWTEIDMHLTMNGEEIDLGKFLEKLASQYDWQIEHAAKRLWRDAVDVSEIEQILFDVKVHMKKKLAEKGVEFTEDDGY